MQQTDRNLESDSRRVVVIALERFLGAMASRDRRSISASLKQDCELARFHEVFGSRLLHLLIDGMSSQTWRISQMEVADGRAAAVLVGENGMKAATVWLSGGPASWQVESAFPFLRSTDLQQVPREIMDLFAGKIDLPADCGDPGLTDFIERLKQGARELLRPGASDFQGKLSSLFDLIRFLRTRLLLWRKLRAEGCRLIGFQITCNSEVYQGVQKESPNLLAVKLLRNTDPPMRERFDREIEILKALQAHPRVPRFIGRSAVEGEPYFVCEWIPGKTLQERILEGHPPWTCSERIGAFLEIVRHALELRLANVIHGDLAPDNILIRDGGGTALVDFGASAFIHSMRPSEGRRAHAKEIRNLGLILCFLLIHRSIRFGSARDCLSSWRIALHELEESASPKCCVRIAKRAIAADAQCRPLVREAMHPYRELTEMLADLEVARPLLP